MMACIKIINNIEHIFALKNQSGNLFSVSSLSKPHRPKMEIKQGIVKILTISDHKLRHILEPNIGGLQII